MNRLYSGVIFIALMLISQMAFAIPEANFWYFGRGAGLDFSSGNPVELTNGQTNTVEGVASISDASGNLLFYTDGVNVYNRNHVVMSNGAGPFAGGNSTTQAATILPMPGQPSQYYIFTPTQGTGTGIQYSVVDMRMDNGLGAVTSIKNQLIDNAPRSEKLTLTPHANGTDYWLMAYDGPTGTYFAYLISGSTVSTMPVTSAVGAPVGQTSIGYMRASVDGRHVVNAHYIEDVVDVLFFDNATGTYTLRGRLTGIANPYGVEISLSGKYAYIAEFMDRTIVQLDLSVADTDLQTSFVDAATIAGSGFVGSAAGMSLRPDGKIYVSRFDANAVGVINDPEAAAASINFVAEVVTLTNQATGGLPIYTYLYRLFNVAITAPTEGSVTNDNTPSIEGSSKEAVTVEVTIEDANGNAVQTLNPTVNADGSWNIDATQLADGTYVIQAQGTNMQGDTTDATPVKFEVDTMPPVVSITTPALTNDNTPTISGMAEVGSTLVVEVLDAQGNVVETLNPTVDAMGNWSVDAAQLPDGNYTVSVVGTDAAGNASQPVTQGFEVDTVPPALTVVNLPDNTLTNDNTPTFDGTAEAGASIEVVIVDSMGVAVETLTTTADAQGNWSVDVAQLADGAYSVGVVATDAAGNATTVRQGFEVDATPPAVAVLTPADGSQTNDNTPTVSGTVEPGATLMVTLTDANNMTTTLMVTPDALGAWAVDTAQLPDGDYTVTATATDLAGNTANATSTFTVDTTPPVLTVATPADGAQTNDNTPTISGSTEPGASVMVTVLDAQGAVVEVLTPMVDAMGNWSVDAAQLPDGNYTVTAVSTDAVGNASQPVSNTFAVDTVPPALAIDTPMDGALLDSSDFGVTGTSDPGQDVTVEVIDANGNVVGTQSATADAQGNWTVMFTGVPDGVVTVRAQTTDAAGNVATVDRNLTIDAAEPVIAIIEPAADTTTNEVRPAINGTTDTDASVTVVVTDGQGNEVANVQPTVDAQGNWTVALDADLADGDYTITATATRPNGKMASTSVDVTIDTMAPDTTITSPADGMVGNMNQPEITGTTDPGATVDVTVTNAAGTVVFTGQVIADDQGNWSVTPDSPLADDKYTISATSTDAAGNEGTPSTSTFTVDTNAPMVMVTSPSNGDTVEDTTPTITGTAEPGATVTVIIDGMEAGQATADDMGNWSFDVTDELAEGEHKIEAKTTDDAGNEGTSGELTVTIAEPKAPVTITTPTEGGEVTGPDVTVTGTGEPGEEVTVSIGGNEQTVTVDENGEWSVTFNDALEGEQTIAARTDGMAPVTITVTVKNADAAKFYVTGGCASTGGSPASTLWLLGLVGLVALRRRRRA